MDNAIDDTPLVASSFSYGSTEQSYSYEDHHLQIDQDTATTTSSSSSSQNNNNNNKPIIMTSSSSDQQEGPSSLFWTIALEFIKFTYSVALLLFSIVIVCAAILQQSDTEQQDNDEDKGFWASLQFHSGLSLALFWFLIFWLAMMEGGQGCLVGLQPIDPQLYQDTHPRSYRNTQLAHQGDNMERFIVGRQFLVVLVMFVSNVLVTSGPANEEQDGSGSGSSSSISAAASAFLDALPDPIVSIFLSSGVALMLIAIMLGQLTAQINAADCMLDFINNYFMVYLVTFTSLAIEYSGLLHCVYLVQMIFCKFITHTDIPTKEGPRTKRQKFFFWCRVMFSCAILAWAWVVTLTALFQGQTTMWGEGSISPVVSVVIFVLLMSIVGLMEGMQIAFFAVVNMPEEELHETTAGHNCEIVFTGQNLQAFLIGRQICVTICMFVVARITTLNVPSGDTLLGASDELQQFYNTGLLSALITTVHASLAWRVIASSFPVPFLSNPLVYIIIQLCLALEQSGLCSASWILARGQKYLAGYQPDSVYLEAAEAKAAQLREELARKTGLTKAMDRRAAMSRSMRDLSSSMISSSRHIASRRDSLFSYSSSSRRSGHAHSLRIQLMSQSDNGQRRHSISQTAPSVRRRTFTQQERSFSTMSHSSASRRSSFLEARAFASINIQFDEDDEIGTNASPTDAMSPSSMTSIGEMA